jgi:hypothetical protein
MLRATKGSHQRAKADSDSDGIMSVSGHSFLVVSF